MASHQYGRNVFLNCPFDDAYKPLFDAAVFAIHDCGFRVRCALEEEDSGKIRISKIYDMIAQCRLGIHDLSRTEVSDVSKLPRFNMPLELGIFLGARQYGGPAQRRKACLILDRQRYRYQQYISDLAGQDPKSHENKPGEMIRCIRDWLSHHAPRGVILPGPTLMVNRYDRFRAKLPATLRKVGIEYGQLIYNDYTNFVVGWLKENPWG